MNLFVRVHLVIENLELRKLSTFLIDRAKLSLIGPTIAVNISIPEILATGYYNISGILGDMYPLRGAGSFEMTVRGFRAYVNTVLGYARGMYMKKFELDFSLRAIKIYLENFMGGEKIGQIMSQVRWYIIKYACNSTIYVVIKCTLTLHCPLAIYNSLLSLESNQLTRGQIDRCTAEICVAAEVTDTSELND